MRFLLFAVVMLILVSGCTQQQVLVDPLEGTEGFDYERDGKTYNPSTQTGLGESMTWIKDNLPEDAVISAWWDYGHMIRGVTEREVIVFNPSEEILYTVSMVAAGGEFDTENLGELSEHGDIENIANILTTTSPIEAIDLMNSYSSEYLMVTTHERTKSWVIYNVSGAEAEQLDEYTFVNEDSMMYMMLDDKDIEGFEKIYSDSVVVIYRIV